MKSPAAITKQPFRLLTIASRPSDLVEMADLTRALAERGHRVTLLYFYSSTDPSAPPTLESVIALGAEPRIRTASVDVAVAPPPELRLHSWVAAVPVVASGAALTAKTTSWASSFFSNLRMGTVTMPKLPRLPKLPELPKMPSLFGMLRNAVTWIRRHNLHVYPKNTWLSRALYTVAFRIDNLGSPREMLETFRQMIEIRKKIQERQPEGETDVMSTAYQGAAMVALYNRFLQFFVRSIRKRSFDALLLPEDIVGNIWPVAIAAAQQRGIPALVVPYTLANRAEAVQSLKGEEAFQTRNNELAAQTYPRWRFQEGDIDIVRLPSSHIFAHEELGIAPPDPWMMNSGFADKILVDSHASLEYFLIGGIPSEQIAIVGSPSQDRMFNLRRQRAAHLQRLRTDLGFADQKPLLLVSGCPNQLSATVPFCEFKTMEEVAQFVGQAVAPLAEHYHLVVRPHPNFIEFGAMLERFGVRSTTAPTASLVPLSDLFIAFASATIRWAIACGIPTVNYDVFHYGYGDFASAAGVASVTASTEFQDFVRTLVPGSSSMVQLAESASGDSAHWSLMDGGSVCRIEEAIVRARQRRKDLAKGQPRHA